MNRFSFWLVLFAASTAAAQGPELTIQEALRRAEAVSPEFKAAQTREAEARSDVDVAKSFYYPTADVEAIQSYGFAGSNGALGIEGLMGSPFRKGPGAGLVSKLTLFDWGRGYGVTAAERRLEAASAATQITRFELDQAVLQVYFEASRFRGEQEAWTQIREETDRVAKKVARLVRTGQHAQVEDDLIEDQAEEAAMSEEMFAERYANAEKRLALLVGLEEKSAACPAPGQLSDRDLAVIQGGSLSPLIARASAELETAQALAKRARAGHYPKLTALASVGDVDQAQLVQKKYYSGGFGLDLPLFEGFRVASDVRRAESAVEERHDDLEAARLELDELNARYDDAVGSSDIRLRHLARQREAARRALDSAFNRYVQFLGPLVEVREALRNLARIENQINEVQADRWLAMGSKALLNGGVVPK